MGHHNPKSTTLTSQRHKRSPPLSPNMGQTTCLQRRRRRRSGRSLIGGVRACRPNRSTNGGGGDSTTPFPRIPPERPLPGIGLHDPLHDGQAYFEFNLFFLGFRQIRPRELFVPCCPSQNGDKIVISLPPTRETARLAHLLTTVCPIRKYRHPPSRPEGEK